MKNNIDKLGFVLVIGLGIIIGYISGVHDGIERAEIECGIVHYK